MKHRLTPRALFHVRVVGRRGRSLQVRPRLRPRLPPLSRSHAVTDKDLRAKFISPPPYVFLIAQPRRAGRSPALTLDETRRSTTIRAAWMERVYAARSHTSARSAFLCDFYRSRSPSRVLNTILNTISLASNFTPQETRGPLAMMPVEAMSAAAARCTYRSKSSREGVDRGAWRVALLLGSCLLVSSFGVAESSCVANVEPSTYDLRV